MVKFLLKKTTLLQSHFQKGQIIFLDKKDYVATINSANLNLEFNKILSKPH